MSESVSEVRGEAPDAGERATETDAEHHEALSHDDLFHVLQNRRRRRILQYLVDREDGPFEMRQLAERVAAWEHDTSPEALSSDQRQRVYVALYQSHLPKLDDVGLIDYDKPRGVVAKRPAIDQVVEYLPENPNEDTGSGDEPPSTDEESRPPSDGSPDPFIHGRVLFAGLGVTSLLGAWTGIVPDMAALCAVVLVGLAVTAVGVARR